MDSTMDPEAPIRIRRWSTERPLLALVVLVAIGLWLVLAFSLIGIFYAGLFAIFFFFAHLAFIAHLRGSGVRLGPEQMSELYERVREIARRIGMRPTPDAYLIQSGGELNALATRFLGSQFIVLYSSLLDACGENEEARDFIIAHELGHLRAGHLRVRWLLLPGLLMPFLGTAYSRACEYTCDRLGWDTARGKERALDGLCVLAAGGQWGSRVNRRAFVSQRKDVNSFWMRIGTWMSTHPPISARLAALQPELGEGVPLSRRPAVAAASVLLLLALVPVAGTASFAYKLWPAMKAGMEAQARAQTPAGPRPAADFTSLEAQAEAGIHSLVEAAEACRRNGGKPPADVNILYRAWGKLHPGMSEPVDPFDGKWFGYELEKGEYYIWSSGPDPKAAQDNIEYSSARARSQ